ncbi:MAG: hypothetical protein GF421_02565 [Candidatus Aminicenantes bacterium]|nr:hypothetical protein [Candidatus Aminicenantes bacterium]
MSSQHSSETESVDYLEFIARVTSYIPDKGRVMVRDYSLYTNAHREKMRKAQLSMAAEGQSEYM